MSVVQHWHRETPSPQHGAAETGRPEATGTSRRRPAAVWWRFVLRRAGRTLGSLFVIVSVAFVVVRLSAGDPVRQALGPTAPPSLIAERRAQLGLDLPLWRQYADYLGGLLHGDLGTSILTGQPVTDVVEGRLPKSLALAALAVLVTLLIAVPVGLTTAVLTREGRRRGLELGFNGATGLTTAVPEFLLGTGLVIAFGIWWPVLPVAGSDSTASYVLPVLALAAPSSAVIARVARVEGLKVLGRDYMRTARSKRLPTATLYLRHALPNMLTAVLTLAGTTAAGMVAATALVEQVFNWPGLGYALIQAISGRDYNIVGGIALVYATLIILINLFVDVLLALLDRRTTLLER
ncbi:ABC transporter permease [Streptomyces fuscichromogenes]|uniref:Peptide ABC transporter permease n=1 Tax=Streptomyces fuscichromogenes TaxID=1324013 RepID=A0A917UJA0_9ACTN|nr:ABC transporter permease [Streptomyces fuscichromogenes]GGM97297.1 peptide ABC transporter permease [Streptomyces fuscichromogenes]